MTNLQNCYWPGNIRELENVIERAVITSNGPVLQLLDNLNGSQCKNMESASDSTLEEMERVHIFQILEKTQWRIEGPKGAAIILGMNPSTLRSRIRKLGIHKSA
jgi:transcriptional regulator with GAF, ATPase, and Fis domain